MDPRNSTLPPRKRKRAPSVAEAPAQPNTGRPSGIAGLASWLASLPLPAFGSRRDRREAWLQRKEARGISGQPSPSAAMATPGGGFAGAVASFTGAVASFTVPAMPPAPAYDELPDLSALIAAEPLAAPELVPAWVKADAPRMLLDPPGIGDAAEGAEFFRLFRQNVDGLSELARLAD